MLKQLKLRKKIQLKKKEAEKIRAEEKELEKREAELEKALEECETDEDMAIVEEDVEKLETDKKENSEKKSTIEKEIEELEKELKETEDKDNKQKEDDKKEEEEQKQDNLEDERANKNYENERGQNRMNKRKSKYVDYLSKRERKEYVQRDDVKKFLTNIRKAVEKRSITDLDLTIPNVTMELIRDNIGNYSTFYKLVNLRPVGGTARANIIEEAVEGIWTEMIGELNELEYGLSKVEVDGYKVGGFTGADNSIIEDSDEDVSILVEDLLSESIAIAIDKAIPYGKKLDDNGNKAKMPTGYVTEIVSDDKLKTTNIINLTTAKTKLAEIVSAFGNIDRGITNRGEVTVVMNEQTWLKTILPLSLATNSSGAYVSALQRVFPGTGYPVEFCNQIPVGDIHAGDYSKYLLAERKGKKVTSSTEAKFIQDITLFKATARYDGIPTRKQAFVIIGTNGVNATTSVTFAPDKANTKTETPAETPKAPSGSEENK